MKFLDRCRYIRIKELYPELPRYAIIQSREVTLLEAIPSVDSLDAFAISEDAQGIKRFILSKERNKGAASFKHNDALDKNAKLAFYQRISIKTTNKGALLPISAKQKLQEYLEQ